MQTPTRPATQIHTHARTRAHTKKIVIFIAFPRQQLFRKRASLLRYTVRTLPLLLCIPLVSVTVGKFLTMGRIKRCMN